MPIGKSSSVYLRVSSSIFAREPLLLSSVLGNHVGKTERVAQMTFPVKVTRKQMKRWAILAALCIASMAGQAQVYRCGNTYSPRALQGRT